EFRRALSGGGAAGFLGSASAFFASRGIRVQRVLSDNGSAYKSFVFRDACRSAGVRHTRTQVRHPWTNGRAERFIGTIQRECAYRDFFASDAERALAIALFVPWYNTRRPHTALGGHAAGGWLDRWRVTQVRGD